MDASAARQYSSLSWRCFTGVNALPATAQIQVDSANPSTAPQDTISLDIAITGNGFQKGAKAQWFVTGTTNPAA
jgi:hypothetical protein